MKSIFLSLFIFFSIQIYAQIERPANWTVSFSSNNLKVGETGDIIFRATLKKGWYVYSVGKFESAPSATFTFDKNNTFELIGDIKATKAKHKKDEYIGEYDYFTEKAEFRQKIKVLTSRPIIKGKYEFSTCSNETGVCLPPKEEDFSVEIKISEGNTTKIESSQIDANTLEKSEKVEKIDQKNTFSTIKDSIISKIDSKIEVQEPKTATSENLFSFFLLAFLAGLAALLTPCVFPMIPMTVTFFLKASKSRVEGIGKALFYGFSIIFIYTLIGTLVAKLAGPEAANFLSTHWLPNIFFFVVFILFALSFLGLFEIVLPSAIVNAADSQSDKGGIIGILFMAVTLVLVSFSCTGPIVGTILVASAGGEFLKPIVGMFGFSLAFAIPFTLFAVFPSWLHNLPKSGGWLNTVKVILGFIELGLAFKFLSLADQAYHWNLLDRNTNIAIWIAISLALSFYLFGFITLPHDSKQEKTQVIPLIFGIVCLTFAIYLTPGLFGASLPVFSGYLPPKKNADYQLSGFGNSIQNIEKNQLCGTPKHSDFLHLPHEIQGYFDIKEALDCAKQQHKPVFIDFTGHGCVNCREMEANVWADAEVLKRLKNDFIVVALYVDDKTELPEKDWYISTYDGKQKTSIGKQNADFQIKKYNNNAQPYYLVVDENGNTLDGPVAYNKNVKDFVDFLEMGKQNFKSKL